MRPAPNKLAHETPRLPELLQNPQRQTHSVRGRVRWWTTHLQRATRQVWLGRDSCHRTDDERDRQAPGCAKHRAFDATLSSTTAENKCSSIVACEDQRAAKGRCREAEARAAATAASVVKSIQ